MRGRKRRRKPLRARRPRRRQSGSSKRENSETQVLHHAAASQDLSEGEVTRWDARTSKVTLRHGELKNLGMPPMTMVFQLRVAAPEPALKAGDKVRFRAEQDQGAFVVTQLEVLR